MPALLVFFIVCALCVSECPAQTIPGAADEARPRFDLEGWRLPAGIATPSCWVEIDLDGDGCRELFVGSYDAPASLWHRAGQVFRPLSDVLPDEISAVATAVAADFDGDGFEDLYLGRAPTGPFAWPGRDVSAGWDRLWMNRLRLGRRVFVEATWSSPFQVLDVLADPARANLPHFPLLPRFPVIDFYELRYTHDVLARDFDGDGDLDLVVAHGGWDPLARRGVEVEPLVLAMPCAVYWNVGDTNQDGFPNFIDDGALRHDDVDTPFVETAGVFASSVAASDFDGDGDLDLYFGLMTEDRGVLFSNANSGAVNRYYEARRDASGRMRWLNRSLRALGAQAHREETSAVFALNLDGSATTELLTFSFQDARTTGGAWHRHRAFRFDAVQQRFVERLGAFGALRVSAEELCCSVTPLDADADGDLDFLISGPRLMLIENQGGNFARAGVSAFALPYDATSAFALDGDPNGDGIADRGVMPSALLTGCLSAQSRWFERVGLAWTDQTAPGLPIDLGGTSLALSADFDADGRDDVVLLKGDGRVIAWRALDARRFVDESHLLPVSADRWIVGASWDVDGMNGADLIWIGASGVHSWWRNNGAGRFQALPLPGDALGRMLRSAQILHADFDTDGIEDVVLLRAAEDGAPIAPLRWRGTGTTLVDDASRLPIGAMTSSALGVVFDADADGRFEVLCWNAQRAPELWQGFSGGTHQVRIGVLPPSAVGVGSVAIEDLNGDGTPDFFLAAGDARIGTDRVWLSQTAPGAFPTWNDAVSHTLMVPAGNTSTRASFARFEDMDGDGWRDFAVGRRGGISCFHRRLRSGHWSPPERFPDQAAWLGDGWFSFDQDGDGLQELWIYGPTQTRSYRHSDDY